MIPSRIPSDKLPIIVVQQGRCLVARYRDTGHYEFQVQIAENWQALEPEARAELEAQVGALTEDDHYPCSQQLADRAIFE
jgi:hypothetical protein